jgi:predicted DNA-binding transcriptional regulator AlpA
MTTSELAAYLKKPKATLYGWRYRGEGPPAIVVGGELRYRVSAVASWLKQRESPDDCHP